MHRGFIPVVVLVPVAIFSFLLLSLTASKITLKTDGRDKVLGVLLAKGDDSGGEDSSNSGSSGSSDDDKSSQDDSSHENEDDGQDVPKSSSGSLSTQPTSTEKPKASQSPKVKVEQKTSNKVKTEVKISEGEKIKTEVKDDRQRVDVYSGGVKVRYEIRNDRVIVKAQTEDGEDVPDDEIFKIVERADKSGIKISTEGAKLVVSSNNVGAVSAFPVQINLSTNELIASTSAGPKVLTVLPDAAVSNIIAAKIISRALSQVDSGIVSLGEKNGLPAYEINGIKDHKLIGFIPLSTKVKSFVSAIDGTVLAKEQSLLSRMIDVLSF